MDSQDNRFFELHRGTPLKVNGCGTAGGPAGSWSLPPCHSNCWASIIVNCRNPLSGNLPGTVLWAPSTHHIFHCLDICSRDPAEASTTLRSDCPKLAAASASAGIINGGSEVAKVILSSILSDRPAHLDTIFASKFAATICSIRNFQKHLADLPICKKPLLAKKKNPAARAVEILQDHRELRHFGSWIDNGKATASNHSGGSNGLWENSILPILSRYRFGWKIHLGYWFPSDLQTQHYRSRRCWRWQCCYRWPASIWFWVLTPLACSHGSK